MTRKRNRLPNVLCAGLPRTGTTTLNGVMLWLGFDVALNCETDTGKHLIPDPYDISNAGHLFDWYNCIIGLPAAHYAKEIHDATGCKVILLERDAEEWVKSMRWLHQYGEAGDYGTNFLYFGAEKLTTETRDAWKRHFIERNEQIKRDIPSRDLLVMNICGGDGWDKLCSFLFEPWPITNQRISREWIYNDWKQKRAALQKG